MSYHTKGRLAQSVDDIAQYRRILEADRFQEDEVHWNSVSKTVITLFQVLIDQDLRDLVAVLEAYPRYIPIVCEHFRYAYSYSENVADIDAVSRLLQLGEPYFTKQFVRNVTRKLPTIEFQELDALKAFAQHIAAHHGLWHHIVTNHYYEALMHELDRRALHPLQRLAIQKIIKDIRMIETFDYEAEDRDAALDIPYMN
jgi:hypothetical protein